MRYPAILFFAKCRLYPLFPQRTSNLLQTWRSSSIFISYRKICPSKFTSTSILYNKNSPTSYPTPWGLGTDSVQHLGCQSRQCESGRAKSPWRTLGGQVGGTLLCGCWLVLEGFWKDQRWLVGFVLVLVRENEQTLPFFERIFGA